MNKVSKEELIKQIEIRPGTSGLLIINSQQVDDDTVNELVAQLNSVGFKGLIALCEGDVRSAVELHVVNDPGEASPNEGGDAKS